MIIDNTAFPLPPNLPRPHNDGAADHLGGLLMPKVLLTSTRGRIVDLSNLAASRTVMYCYPMTGVPGQSLPAGWDAIPGARGCTPQTCGFRDHYQPLSHLNAEVFGLSTQSSDYQREVLKRLTLIVRSRQIEHVFYPVFPPDRNAEQVVNWLKDHPVADHGGSGLA